jgi:hypothetical protein
VPNPANHELYNKYKAMSENEPGVCFVGRLAGGLLRTCTPPQTGARLTFRVDAHIDARTRLVVEYSRPTYEHVPSS